MALPADCNNAKKKYGEVTETIGTTRPFPWQYYSIYLQPWNALYVVRSFATVDQAGLRSDRSSSKRFFLHSVLLGQEPAWLRGQRCVSIATRRCRSHAARRPGWPKAQKNKLASSIHPASSRLHKATSSSSSPSHPPSHPPTQRFGLASIDSSHFTLSSSSLFFAGY